MARMDYPRGLIDGIIKAYQLMMLDGKRFASLSVRIHPHDYMTLGLEAKFGSVIHVEEDGNISMLGMPFVKDENIHIGTTIVESSGR